VGPHRVRKSRPDPYAGYRAVPSRTPRRLSADIFVYSANYPNKVPCEHERTASSRRMS
jgi:hypothetical protein